MAGRGPARRQAREGIGLGRKKIRKEEKKDRKIKKD
jgi:hypothetical protein